MIKKPSESCILVPAGLHNTIVILKRIVYAVNSSTQVGKAFMNGFLMIDVVVYLSKKIKLDSLYQTKAFDP